MASLAPLSPGACKILAPRPDAEDVELILQVSASVYVVGIPPYQHCVALFDGDKTIPAMLAPELSADLAVIIGALEKAVVALERVSWWEHPRTRTQILVIEAMHIIEDREDFICPAMALSRA